jgi:TrkA domain protein
MTTIREADLPGIGRKFEIPIRSGEKLVIVIHDDGRRELYVFPTVAADQSIAMVTLTDQEARQIAGILGGLSYIPRALASVELALRDLVIEWYALAPGAPSIGKTIGELGVRQKTGASIMAMVERDQRPIINPGPEQVLPAGATLIVVGERRMINAFKQLMAQGSG